MYFQTNSKPTCNNKKIMQQVYPSTGEIKLIAGETVGIMKSPNKECAGLQRKTEQTLGISGSRAIHLGSGMAALRPRM
jgi:hypothetical protein